MDLFPFKIMGGMFFGYIVIIFLIIFISWKIGKFLGTHLSQTTGLIIGIILIIFGFTLFVAIPCIIYSQKNKDKSLDLDFKITNNVNSNINRTSNVNSRDTYERKVVPNHTERIHPSPYQEKSFSEILLKNDLYNYISIFKDNKLDSIAIVKTLNEHDLEKLGITIMGDRKKILQLIDEVSMSKDVDEFTIVDEKKERLQNIATSFQKPQPERTIISNDPNIWNCPNCNYGNDNNSYKCKNCGYSII